MTTARMTDVPLGLADQVFVRLWSKVHRKVNLDRHTDVFLTEREGSKHIVIKRTFGGDVNYSDFSEADFGNLVACVESMLAQQRTNESNRP
jgi:hypothetical protein